MTITAQELALKCGVSRGTVDRALKGRLGINPATKEKIIQIANECGYRPNFIGRALSSGKTMTIGIVFFDFHHSFFAELYSAFEQEADRFNYITFPMLSYHNPEREIECIKRLVDRNVDGIIILPVNQGKEFEEMLQSLNLPVVCIANRLSAAFPFCGIDDRQAAYDAFDYLSKQTGPIYYFCPPILNRNGINLYAQEQRLAGYEQALQKSGRAGMSITAQSELLKMLEQQKNGAAVMCSNDFYALELQVLLRDNYPALYKSTHIMGFDGLDIVKFSHPQIPTILFSRKEWALKAFGQIYNLLSKEKVKDEIVSHQIVANGSWILK